LKRYREMTNTEIDEGTEYTGYRDALDLIVANISPAKVKSSPLASCAGYVTAEDIVARVNSPTDDVSLKDGFAVKASDVATASPQHPINLQVVGSAFAGAKYEGKISRGQAVKICSGSPLPDGADTVVSGEFCDEVDSKVHIMADAEIRRNIFPAGEDVKAGRTIVKKGEVLLPASLGLIAAGGINRLKVYRKPKVSLIAIGDEVVAIGHSLEEGQLYASNLVNIGAWLSCFKIPYVTTITLDDMESIQNELLKSFPETDAIITSGGAWGSERDLIVRVLDNLGWKRLFHHVRIGPGKGIAFGMWKDKPVFCLPGGPPSNEMAFMQLALPGILRMAGRTGSPLITVSARLTQDVKGRHKAWTEFKKGQLAHDSDRYYSVTPLFETSRLKSMADATCIICKPEGVESLHRDQIVTVQVILPTFSGLSIADR
jgi:molybdopterin molybdotransferase